MLATIPPRRWLLILVCVLILSGCTTMKSLPKVPLIPGQDDKPQQPETIVGMWSDMVVHQSDGRAVRGLGGRLTFYTNKGSKPVRVDGTLVVYGFEEQGDPQTKVKPDKKFIFTPEQFARHYEKSALGHSYTVWIPWDEAQGPQKEVSVIVRFTPKDGQLVVGQPTRHVLPGPSSASQIADGRNTRSGSSRGGAESGVRPVSYEPSAGSGRGVPAGAEAAGTKIETTTIPLPPDFAYPQSASFPRRSMQPMPAYRSPLPTAGAAYAATVPDSANAGMVNSLPRATPGGAFPTERSNARVMEQPSRGFRPGQPRVLASSVAQPSRDRAPTQPRLGEPRYPRGATLPTEPLTGSDWAASELPLAPR